jgi:hypothetical protein
LRIRRISGFTLDYIWGSLRAPVWQPVLMHEIRRYGRRDGAADGEEMPSLTLLGQLARRAEAACVAEHP